MQRRDPGVRRVRALGRPQGVSLTPCGVLKSDTGGEQLDPRPFARHVITANDMRSVPFSTVMENWVMGGLWEASKPLSALLLRTWTQCAAASYAQRTARRSACAGATGVAAVNDYPSPHKKERRRHGAERRYHTAAQLPTHDPRDVADRGPPVVPPWQGGYPMDVSCYGNVGEQQSNLTG
jgi:hypothetical protein